MQHQQSDLYEESCLYTVLWEANHSIMYRKSAKVRVKNVHFLNVRVKKYSRSEDSYVLQCILLKTFVRLMFAVLAIRELFLTVNFCRFTVHSYVASYLL